MHPSHHRLTILLLFQSWRASLLRRGQGKKLVWLEETSRLLIVAHAASASSFSLAHGPENLPQQGFVPLTMIDGQ